MKWLLLLSALFLQDVKHDTPPRPVPVHIDVELTTLDVSVMTVDGRLLNGLWAHNFRVFEDGVEQEVIYLSQDDTPVSVGVVFDNSGSMANKIGASREAMIDFFKTSNPQDEFFVTVFSEKAEILSDFTSSVEDLQLRLAMMEPKGRTALLDAVYLSLAQLKRAKYARKALILISDGGDNHSRYSERDIKYASRECDCQIYAIGVFSPQNERYTVEEIWGPTILYEIVEMTGGRAWAVKTGKDLTDVTTGISRILREEYVLGYHPSNHNHDGRWRKVKVKMKDIPKGIPPLVVKTKSGYYAATR